MLLKKKYYSLDLALRQLKVKVLPFTYDDAQESYVARYTAETVALAFAITEEAMEDNLYDTFAKLRAKGLARAMANTKQVKAANLFNNGFATAIGDGAAFLFCCTPNHLCW